MNKQPIFLTDGKGSIYKIEKLIRAAILKNLETGESITAEIIGSNVTGFAMIDMPKIPVSPSVPRGRKDVPANLPKTAPASRIFAEASVGKSHKVYKPRKNKSSQYFGVTFNKKASKKKWGTAIWLDGKNVSVGVFETELEAGRAVDAKLEERGLPKRNFP